MQKIEKTVTDMETHKKWSRLCNTVKTPKPGDHHLLWGEVNMGELDEAVGNTAPRKATGNDEMPSEALKNMGADAKNVLLKRINHMWAMSTTPNEWSKAVTKLLHKKGPTDELKNYRPITLLNSLFKVWEKILEQRARKMIKNKFPNEAQMGSQTRNSCEIAIMVKRSLYRYARAMGHHIHSMQVDLNKAYNRVNRKKLWIKIEKMGIRGKLLLAIKSTYEMARDVIKIGNSASKPFHLTHGLRQGSVLSPLLFILYMDELLEELQANTKGAQVPGARSNGVAALMFVDDLETFTSDTADMKKQHEIAARYALNNDAVISAEKSTITSSSLASSINPEIDNLNLGLTITKSVKVLGYKSCPRELVSTNLKRARPLTEVAYRAGTTQGIAKIMTRRGLKLGGIHTNPSITVVKTILLMNLKYGLSVLEMQKVDKKEVRKPINKVVRNILGSHTVADDTETATAEAEWIIIETGITDPVDIICITEISVVLRARLGQINPKAASIILADKELTNQLKLICAVWNTPQDDLIKIKQNAWSTKLKKAARKTRLNKFYAVRGNKLDPITVPMNEETKPIWEKAELNSKQIQSLVHLRRVLVSGDKEWKRPCLQCESENNCTLRHILLQCKHNGMTTARKAATLGLDKMSRELWNKLNPAIIAEITGCDKSVMSILVAILDIFSRWNTLKRPENPI